MSGQCSRQRAKALQAIETARNSRRSRAVAPSFAVSLLARVLAARMSHSYAPVAPAPDSQPTHLATASPRRRRLALSSRSWGALAAAAVLLALFGSLHEPTRRHTTSAAKATLAGIWPAEEVDERTQLSGRYEEMLARVMLHPEQPPESWKDQVVPGEQYLFSNFFGGQSE